MNGHWYTDKNGNHYFVENGQSPKEGWEASKRRKMINNGKYNVSEDGENYKEVSKDDYDKYEADETEFDETVDDDFGFDEEESEEYNRDESIRQGVEYFKNHYSESEFLNPMSFMEKRMKDWPGDERAEILDIIKTNEKDNKEKPLHIRSLEKQIAKNPDYKAIADALSDDRDMNDAYFYAFKDAYEKHNYKPQGVDIASELSDRYWSLADSYRDRYGMSDREWDDYGVSDFEEKYGTESDFVDKGMEAHNKYFDNVDLNEQGNNDNLNPNNPKYKGFDRSSITNAKLVDEGYEFTDTDSDKKVKNSIIEYIPYGALQDGDNEKLYAIVKNYDGTDTPKTGAIVAHSLEDAKEQLERQTQLGIQGKDRYLMRGRYDEDYFNLIRDNREPGDDEKYKERYGWDFNKPFAEHDFMKNDPYEKWKAERETAKTSNDEKLSKELMTSLKMPGDEVERFLKDLPEDKKKILTEWLLNTKRM